VNILSHVSPDRIDKAIKKADIKVNEPFELKHIGDLKASLNSLSDDDRTYMKRLLSETLHELFGSKKRK
jgi:hypothetical protein